MNLVLVKLLSTDFSVLDAYQYTLPAGYLTPYAFMDKLISQSDSSGDLLIYLSFNTMSGNSENCLLIWHDFNSATPLKALKELSPGSVTGNIFSRFKRRIDYANNKGYLLCAVKTKLVFFVIDLTSVILVKGAFVVR